ncbi:hypothetical protein B0H19DRAFT_1159914 [Mycena capillaripes]|nr:hypothetical protein B0H19DRAFT_1159914 [Mycena capillaripes]
MLLSAAKDLSYSGSVQTVQLTLILSCSTNLLSRSVQTNFTARQYFTAAILLRFILIMSWIQLPRLIFSPFHLLRL